MPPVCVLENRSTVYIDYAKVETEQFQYVRNLETRGC